MLKSVKLAEESRTRYIDECPGINRTDIQIALSLGPFGASLPTTQEYDGFYPPPYGPKEYSTDGVNCNAFDDNGDATRKSIGALESFHFERLNVFACNPESWKTIDYVAFETVPLVREVKAIRKAMARLQEEFVKQGRGADYMKPWWISHTFPDGQFPEVERPGGPKLSARQIVVGALEKKQDTDNGGVHDLVPTGLGINCTNLRFLRLHVAKMGLEMANLSDKNTRRPFLVIYPSGGEVYDPISRSWNLEDGEETNSEVWAEELCSVVMAIAKEDIWDGILVGGCCRVGPEKIRALSEILNL